MDYNEEKSVKNDSVKHKFSKNKNKKKNLFTLSVKSDINNESCLSKNDLENRNQIFNDINLPNKYFVDNSQFYDSSLKTSQSSFYLSSLLCNDKNEIIFNSIYSEDCPESNKELKNSTTINLDNASSSLRYNSNEMKSKKDKNTSLNKVVKKNSHNFNDVSSNINPDIKKLSPFLIESRSRSSSPRTSFKTSRKSFNNKHQNKHKLVNYNSNNSLPNSVVSNSYLHSNYSCKYLNNHSNQIENEQYLINNQNLSNNVAAEYIKENYGLLSSSKLKKNLENNYLYLEEESVGEQVFNGFDLKFLRYSFNRVLKRRGGGLSSLSSSNTLNDCHNNLNFNLKDPKKKGDESNLKIIKEKKKDLNNSNKEKITSSDNNQQKKKQKDLVSIMDLIDGKKLYWSEIPLVKEMGLLEKLDLKERQLQEAHFELIASEASYLRSLNLLYKNFYMNTFMCDTNIIDAYKKQNLFSNILEIIEVSHKLLDQLEHRWKKNVYIGTFCDILYKYSIKYFHVYLQYCRFKRCQERTLKELKEKPKFKNILRLLESDVKCERLSLNSFLLLPVQRIMRYPLLIEAILNRSLINSEFYQIAQTCLKSCNEVVNLCNFAAKQYEDYEELISKLKFNNIKCFPLLSSRWLIKIFDIVRIKSDLQSTTLIGSFMSPNWSKTNACLILLSDLILICKKKSEDIYIVIDFCNRNLTETYDIQNKTNSNQKLWGNFKNLIQIVFLCNHASKKVEYYFNFNSEIEKLNWLKLSSINENKKFFKIGENLLDLVKSESNEIIEHNSLYNDSSNTFKKSLGQKKIEKSKHNLNYSKKECTNEIFI